MKMLVLGGSRFAGRALIAEARAAGHEVTAFNRGRSWPTEFNDAELVVGDRRTEMSRLAGRSWDVVIDTCGFNPSDVAISADALRDSVERYIFISTVSVYPWPLPPDTDESGQVAQLEEGFAPDGLEPEMYGARKALCEDAATSAMDGRVLSIRPGMIVGPHDYTDRFTHWIKRAARGGEMLAPGDPDRSVQLLDVGDLARWMLHLASEGTTGVANAVGPVDRRLNWHELLRTCIEATGNRSTLVWVDDNALTQAGVAPGADLPWWVPAAENGIFEVKTTKARELGLRTRPLIETVRETFGWLQSSGKMEPAGLTFERELETITAHSAART